MFEPREQRLADAVARRARARPGGGGQAHAACPAADDPRHGGKVAASHGRSGRVHRRVVAQHVEQQCDDRVGTFEGRQVPGPVEHDALGPRDLLAQQLGDLAEVVEVVGAADTTTVGTLMAVGSTSTRRGSGPGSASSAAICTSNARRCMRVSSARASPSPPGPSQVRTFSSVAPSTSPASRSRSSSASRSLHRFVGSSPRYAAHINTSDDTRAGCSVASSMATRPPNEPPTTAASTTPSSSSRASHRPRPHTPPAASASARSRAGPA